jgi:hypothetical protein
LHPKPKQRGNNLLYRLSPKNEQCGDTAKQLIPPLNLREQQMNWMRDFSADSNTLQNRFSVLLKIWEAHETVEEEKQIGNEKEKAKREKEQEAKDKKFKEGMASG